MLIICEDCGKKFNVDENRIKTKKAKFTCNKCGHVIVVEKPVAKAFDPIREKVSSSKGEEERDHADPERSSSGRKKKYASKGIPISVYIFLTLITGFLMVSGAFGYLYFKYIPNIINNQIELRTSAITESFSGVIHKPLLLRNYLQINKEAKRVSQLPGVAYAAVINKKGIAVAGFFSDIKRFDDQFVGKVKVTGIPVTVLSQNKLSSGKSRATARVFMGGQVIYDEVVAIAGTGAEVHVGIYVSEVDEAIRNVLVSPLTFTILGIILVIGFVVFLLLTRAITVPMHELTSVANRISLGEMDLAVKSRGPREMRDLARAFERMRQSIKGAIERLSR